MYGIVPTTLYSDEELQSIVSSPFGVMALERAPFSESDGMAALSICESLLLTLIDLQIISPKGAYDLLTDVITTHTAAAVVSPEPQKHQAVIEIVERLLRGKGPNKISE